MLHFDNSELAASFFHEQLDEDRSRFLMRLENGVLVRNIGGELLEIVTQDRN